MVAPLPSRLRAAGVGSRPGDEQVARANGVSNYNQLVGDYTNPILKPEAAEIVKKHGELSLAGVTYPNPANQCWPEPVPFIYKNFGHADVAAAGPGSRSSTSRIMKSATCA